MRKSFFSALGCLALVLMTTIPAEAGLFRGLFSRRHQSAGSCGSMGMAGSCGVSQAQSFQSYQSYQSFQSQSVAPVYSAPLPVPSKQVPTSCPGGVCPTSQAVPNRSATAIPQTYGYIYELNSFRARYGLPPVGFDQQMFNDAMANNYEQSRRGMGHFFMGMMRRQNAGWGGPESTIMRMWEASPPHRAALLDPTIRSVAVANYGPAWTFAAR